MDFNALNANNFSDEEEGEEDAQAEQNESFPNQNALEDEEANYSDDAEDANQARNSLPNEDINNNNKINAGAANENQKQNLTSYSREEEKGKTQKSQTYKSNRTNTNRSLEKNKNTNRQTNNVNNNKFDNAEEEDNEKDNAQKQEILSLLLNTDIKPKSVQRREESAERKQKTTNANLNKSKRYQHIESKYKKEKLENDPTYKAGPEKFFINADLDNPEFKADRQNAQRKLLLSTKNASESEKDKIIRKLLFQDLEKQKKIIEVDKVTNNDIKTKLSYYLNKKQKKLDEIESLKDEYIMKECTFQPEFVSEKLFPEKRDLKVFLEDQKNHLKRVHDKVEKVINIPI